MYLWRAATERQAKNTEMSKIAFTSGTITKFAGEYYNIELTNNGRVVYKGMMTPIAAATAIDKHYPKISMA